MEIEAILKRAIMFPGDANILANYIRELQYLAFGTGEYNSKCQLRTTPRNDNNIIAESKKTNEKIDEKLKFNIDRCYTTIFDIIKPSKDAFDSILRRIDIFLTENPNKQIKSRLEAEKSLLIADYEMSTGIATNVSNFVCKSV